MNSSGFSTVNPANGEEIEVFSLFTSADVENTLGLADKTFQLKRLLKRRIQASSDSVATFGHET